MLLLVAIVVVTPFGRCRGEEINSQAVLESIERGKSFLLKAQQADGSWSGENSTFDVGVTSLALLALINTGMTTQEKEIQRGLIWLRDPRRDPDMTYQISLMIQAFAAAKDGKRDTAKVLDLVRKLEESQLRAGQTGSWSYGRSGPVGSGDRSNAQFAILGLRDAQEMGVPVSLDTWRRARSHWIGSQNGDGGWGYSENGDRSSTGSMTVAGIATIVITEAMLRAEQKELNADGAPVCCDPPPPDKALENACRWLGNNFAVGHNPNGSQWLLYYLYGLERAGRFSGRRFFVNGRGDRHDWYREGAEYLVSQQHKLTGTWIGGGIEKNPVIGTSFALMFLSKGLAPVLINKLQYGPHGPKGKGIAGNDWNRHHNDARNLTQLITNLDKWPRLLSWQVVDVSQASVADLKQAPILFLHGTEAPHFTPEEIALLKEYVLQGGFIFAVRGCKSAAFDEGFKDLILRMYPPAEAKLRKLDGTHPVFRSEYRLFDKESGEPTVELYGVDVGCRTSIMYAPDDLACLWGKWTSFDLPRRPKELSTMITKATQVGVNVVAYVTGREIINKLQQQEQEQQVTTIDQVERDLLQIAKMRYTGDWDAAPQALRNLLLALNRTAGLPASAKHRNLTLVDPGLNRYPLLYMHGRHDFALSKGEQERLRNYITQGGVLFADSCCGVAPFDTSFRRLMEQLFPDSEKKLKRIPPDHELFTSKGNGFDLKTVKRREPNVDTGDSALEVSVRSVEPFLEGIEIDGKFVVIYSKYDISCALERQASVACTGYLHEDAVRLAINIVLYSQLQ
jgi:Domain of unknown function (DUF4159)